MSLWKHDFRQSSHVHLSVCDFFTKWIAEPEVSMFTIKYFRISSVMILDIFNKLTIRRQKYNFDDFRVFCWMRSRVI